MASTTKKRSPLPIKEEEDDHSIVRVTSTSRMTALSSTSQVKKKNSLVVKEEVMEETIEMHLPPMPFKGNMASVAKKQSSLPIKKEEDDHSIVKVASTSRMAMAPAPQVKKKVAQVIKDKVMKEIIEMHLPPMPSSAKGKNSQVKGKRPAAKSSKASFSTERKSKCPWKGCEKMCIDSLALQMHYRKMHSRIKPFKCTFPSCRKASCQLWGIYEHICMVHLKKQFNQKKAKKYVQVQKEVLLEEAKQLGIRELFNGEAMSDEANWVVDNFVKKQGKEKRKDPGKCRPSKSPSKPFTCSFPGCNHKGYANISTIIRHIRCVHFKRAPEKFRNLSEKEKKEAEQYISQTLLFKREDQVRKAPKRKILDSTIDSDSDWQSSDTKRALFGDSSDDEEEDDKDELAARLFTV